MTRGDYQKIAAVLKACGARFERSGDHGATGALYVVTSELAAMLQADNPRFNPAKFAAACGMEGDYDA
jgi:hypothetical protein